MNRLVEAAEALEVAGNLMPDCAQIWTDIGDIYRMAGKEAEAARCYEKASMIER